MKLRTIFLVCQLIFCVFGALLIKIMSSIGIFLFIKELVDKKIIVYPKSKNVIGIFIGIIYILVAIAGCYTGIPLILQKLGIL